FRCSMSKPMWMLAVSTPSAAAARGSRCGAGACMEGSAVLAGRFVAVGRIARFVQLVGGHGLAAVLAPGAALAEVRLGAAIALRLLARLAFAEAAALAMSAREPALAGAFLRHRAGRVLAAVAGGIGVATLAAVGGLAFVVGAQRLAHARLHYRGGRPQACVPGHETAVHWRRRTARRSAPARRAQRLYLRVTRA